MNLRILKKLSKRAAPLIAQLGDERKQFRAEPHDCYHCTLIKDRRYFERGRSPHSDLIGERHIKVPARDGHGGFISMRPPAHPLAGTIMVGAVSGYYEPEWDEETAWDALRNLVYWHFIDCSSEELKPTRRLKTPAEIFQGARDMAREG